MGKKLAFICKYFLFWLIYFLILKIVFLVYNYKISFQHVREWPYVFFYGIRLDLSATGYIMLFPLLLLAISVWLKGPWIFRFLRIYTIILLIIFSFLVATDLGLYREWGFRLDLTPWLYLARPKEAFASISVLYIIFHLLIAAILVYLFSRLYRQVNNIPDTISDWRSKIGLTFIIVFIMCFMILPIRGGIGKSAINTGSTYFSETAFLNHATLNLPWNVGFSILNDDITKNPFKFISEGKAQELLGSFTNSSASYQNVLNIKKPNIILCILESFTANVTGCLSGPVQVTPHLDKIAANGILFSQFYASGDRTDKGLLAVLSGFPSQPTTSLIKYINKTENLPSLPKSLKNYGYTSTFYYGGDAEFANYKSYLVNSGFTKIVDLKDFPSDQRICNWGVPDEFLFHKTLSDIRNTKSPYFITLLTLSSHTPFDIPAKPHIVGNTEEIKFFNSVYYADQCIGKFIDSLEKDHLLENTLLIFVADHGFHLPGNLSQNNTLKYHIPMIWYGGAINMTDTTIKKISSQTDIASTILSEMDIPSSSFQYGKNIFSFNSPSKTVFEIDKGFGFISDSLVYFYYSEPNVFSVSKGKIDEKSEMEGKAFYQVLYDDIIKR